MQTSFVLPMRTQREPDLALPGVNTPVAGASIASFSAVLPGLSAQAEVTINDSEAAGLWQSTGHMENVVQQLQADLNDALSTLCKDMQQSFTKKVQDRLSALETELYASSTFVGGGMESSESSTSQTGCESSPLSSLKGMNSATGAKRGWLRWGTAMKPLGSGAKPRKSRLPIHLPTSTLQLAALEAAMTRGQPETAEVVLAAGFLGGGGWGMQACWLLFGALLLMSAVLDTSLPVEVGVCDALCDFMRFDHKMSMILAGILFCSRAFFLHLRSDVAAQRALLVAIAIGAQALLVIGLLSVYVTMEEGCKWRVESYVFHEAGPACVLLGCSDAVILAAQGVPLASMAWNLWRMHLKEAAERFQWFFAIAMVSSYFRLLFGLTLGDVSVLKGQQYLTIIFCTKCALIVMFYRRFSARKKSWRLVKADAKAYNDVWCDIVDREADSIRALSEAADAIATDIKNANIEGPQTALEEAENLRRTLLQSGSKAGGLQQDLMSLPLLFAQAFAVNHHFQVKCAEWAGGLGLYIPGVVKQPRRAIQKIWRSYNGQPQRLVDIVRASIVCDTTLQLLTVLRRIAGDNGAGIVRIKNLFDPSYDSDMTAGYRCLALNIIIVDQRTRSSSTEQHICELQLGLHKMHELKTDGGHSRFVSFRDSSAE
eukprot:TRINITY_DN13766_c0_g2_i1.p1 TRINITY_DN13766_c0_g2~~TRINITY_DN13766_c0_g2_i1.p1  ORF type:complete len:656 (+),score=96.36 TRINITY_DN13766_c0_g2_i1:170-2137(+)